MPHYATNWQVTFAFPIPTISSTLCKVCPFHPLSRLVQKCFFFRFHTLGCCPHPFAPQPRSAPHNGFGTSRLLQKMFLMSTIDTKFQLNRTQGLCTLYTWICRMFVDMLRVQMSLCQKRIFSSSQLDKIIFISRKKTFKYKHLQTR